MSVPTSMSVLANGSSAERVDNLKKGGITIKNNKNHSYCSLNE